MQIKRNEKIVARKIHDSYFLIDITDNYSNNTCALYEMNETGMFIWNNIGEGSSIFELASQLKAIIIDDVIFQVLYDDVLEFIEWLDTRGFVEVINHG